MKLAMAARLRTLGILLEGVREYLTKQRIKPNSTRIIKCNREFKYYSVVKDIGKLIELAKDKGSSKLRNYKGVETVEIVERKGHAGHRHSARSGPVDDDRGIGCNRVIGKDERVKNNCEIC